MSLSKLSRSFLKATALLCALVLIVSVVALFILQTGWFEEQVRRRIVAAVQEASGGSVELGNFSYNWQTLTATFERFVIHGTEPPSGSPLFRASRIKVGLRILSVFERRVAVSSIVVEQPDIYILVRTDGSTNIPTPDLRQRNPHKVIQELLNLKLRHCEIRHGTLKANLQQIPLDMRADDTSLLLTYYRRGPAYVAKVVARQFYVNSEAFQPVAMSASLQARLEKDKLTLESASFRS